MNELPELRKGNTVNTVSRMLHPLKTTATVTTKKQSTARFLLLHLPLPRQPLNGRSENSLKNLPSDSFKWSEILSLIISVWNSISSGQSFTTAASAVCSSRAAIQTVLSLCYYDSC
jgi:hypothetical protein